MEKQPELIASTPSGINPKRAHFNAGTSRYSSGASFAQELRSWWHRQTLFCRQADLEAAYGIRPGTFALWMAGRAFPSDQWCDVLHSLTGLPCFSPEGRKAARVEHEQKRGLSRTGIAKRLQRNYATPEQLSECLTDIQKAKTICAPDGVVCLGRRGDTCGQILKALKAKGAGAHLAEHGYASNKEYRNEWGYSPGTSLVCESRTAALRELAAKGGHLKPNAGRAYLRPPSSKGRVRSLEFRLKQSDRMRGTQNLERDTEILRLWLCESRPIKEVAREIGLSQGRVHAILQRIFGIRVKQRIVFSRGEPVTDLWVNAFCERFGFSKQELGKLLRLEPGSVHWLQQLGAAGKNRALTPETAEPLVYGEGLFLEILAGADTSAGNRADYLCAVVPDLAEKRDGASLAIGIARDWAGLKEVCGSAQTGNRRARIALAFVPSAVACFQTLSGETRSLPVSELVRERFLPMELKTRPFLLREAIEHVGSAETKPPTIRGIIMSAFRAKELEERLAARAKGGAPKKDNPEFVIFGQTVTSLLSHFEKGLRIYRTRESTELRKAGYTELEIDCIRDSRTANTAAIRWACKNSKPKIALKTGKNYFSMFSAYRKHPSRERPE